MRIISFCYEGKDGGFFCGDKRGECYYYQQITDGKKCASSGFSESNNNPCCFNNGAQIHANRGSVPFEACDRVYDMISGVLHNIVKHSGSEYNVIGWYDDYDAHIHDCVVLRKQGQATVRMVHWSKLFADLVEKYIKED